MDFNRLLSRKTFIRLCGVAAAGMALAVWAQLTGRQKEIQQQSDALQLNPETLSPGVHFFDDYIVSKNGEGIKIFVNRCSHAQCKINKEENGLLICPCHGSKYDAVTGAVRQGPALKPLPIVSAQPDKQTEIITLKPILL